MNKFSKNYILRIEQSVQKENKMNTYLIWSSIVLHILIFLVAVIVIRDEISARKKSKKLAAEYARKKAVYKAELVIVKQVWQKWVKKLAELQRDCNKESNAIKRLQLKTQIEMQMNPQVGEQYYFISLRRNVSLYVLGKENKWTLEEEPSQQTG